MPGPSPLTTTPNTLACFTESEIRSLVWLRGTVAAERHLVPIDQPCPDHEQCRRLAFALWLRVTEHLSEVADPDRQSTPLRREEAPRPTACPRVPCSGRPPANCLEDALTLPLPQPVNIPSSPD